MPRVAPEVRQQTIISAALKLFQKNGFDSVRVDDILQQVGLSKGGFYHHFKSREDILRQIVIDEITSTFAGTDDLKIKNDPVAALIELFLKGSTSLGAKEGVLGTLESFASKSIYLDELERQLSLQLKPHIAKIIESGVSAKVFREVDCAATAEIVMAVNDHGNRCAVLESLSADQLKAYNLTAMESLGRHLGIETELQKLIAVLESKKLENEGSKT
jgi:AcrR family transcriptional regulator